MWFISRCISVDSLNSCFQQPKNRMSYNFDLCKNEKDILARRKDEDDWQPFTKKPLYTHHQYNQIRRRIPKRYSDIISPSSKRIYISRKDSTNREKYIPHKRSSIYIPRRHSLKPSHETTYYFNSSKRKTREIKDYHYNQLLKHNDHLAHRMQTVMNKELKHSFDRNFILRNHLAVSRSHSFNVFTSSSKKHSEYNSSYHFIPRVKLDLTKTNKLFDEPKTINQNQEFIIRKIENNTNITEEPIVDYTDDDDDDEDKTKTNTNEKLDQTDFDLSSASFIVPETITTNNNEEQSSIPSPPPLPDLNSEQKNTIFRCRTIADTLSSEHKLILKDEKTNLSEPSEEPHYLHVSKELTLTKISQTISRSQSLSYLTPQTNNNNEQTDIENLSKKSFIIDEQIQDCLLSSSTAGTTTTSTTVDNEYEHRSSSSKIYNDYKKRTSLTNPSTTTTTKILNHHHSMIIHPMHTKIGLRSSTSSSINEKLPDMTLIKKQMNVCLINQLNQHLSTRFRKQQEESCFNQINQQQQSYDRPPEFMSNHNNKIQTNFYDEPQDISSQTINPICSPSIPPPPPPPLPVGGFPPINRLSNNTQQQSQQRMTLEHNRKKSDTQACSTGTSTISSNLSDSRILHELRENPLFTRAKQHLEIDRDSNNQQLNDSISYLRLDNCSKIKTESLNSKQLETIIMLPNELDTIIGKQIKSTNNNMKKIKSRSSIKFSNQKQYRQSELEMIFQKRAQRSEQNLT